jgi:hypothetical protein
MGFSSAKKLLTLYKVKVPILNEKKEVEGGGCGCLAAARWQRQWAGSGVVSAVVVAVLAAQWRRWRQRGGGGGSTALAAAARRRQRRQ